MPQRNWTFLPLWPKSWVPWSIWRKWQLLVPSSDPHNSLTLHSFTGSICFYFLTAFSFICSWIAKTVVFCKRNGNTSPDTASLACASGDLVEMLSILTPTERKCSQCADTFSILCRYGFLDAFWHHYQPSIWLPSLFCKTTLNPNTQSPRENIHHQIVFLPLWQFQYLDPNETELINRLEGKQINSSFIAFKIQWDAE